MTQQLLKKKPKEEEKEPLSNGELLEKVVNETVEKLSKIAQNVASRIFDMGKIVYDEREKLNPNKILRFYIETSSKLYRLKQVELSPISLRLYCTFYENFLKLKIKSKDLHIVGFEFLRALFSKTDDPKKAREVLDKAIAFKKEWPEESIFPILEQEFPKPPEDRTPILVAYDNWKNAAKTLSDSFNEIIQAKEEAVKELGVKKIQSMARNTMIIFRATLPRFLEFLIEMDIKPDEAMQMLDTLLKKYRR